MDDADQRFLVLGHRGSPRRHTENTAASFAAALDEGADGFETDLRALRCGSAVLFHDHSFEHRPVEQYELAVLAERVAGLMLVRDLEPFAGRALVVLEVKRRGWESQLIELVAGWPRIVVSSFDHRVIAELARRDFAGGLGIIYNGSPAHPGRYAASIGAQWAFPHHVAVDEEMTAELRESGVCAVPWSPNSPAEWSRLRALGCAGVITDLPREAVEWRSGAS